ncbi:MAG: hypothetical protein QMC27_00580, partial [Flavobacteriaceae bacterium]
IYREAVDAWGIWHNNPINSFDFTRATTTGIEQNVGGTTNTVMIRLNNTDGSGIFVGSVTSPTFLGDLNGTINTATTGTTQTAGNNSTLIATTAYADAAAAAVPIGNYLPLSAGSSYPLTGDLYITKAATPLIQLTDTTNSKTLLLGVDDANAFIRTGASENLYLQVNGGTNAITILNNSNVGIGDTNPGRKLVLDGTLGTPALEIKKNTDRIVYLGTGSSASADDNTILHLMDQNVVKINLNTVGDSYFNGGDVGIGTTNPGAKLDVNGTGYYSDLLRVDEPVYSYTDSGTKHYTHLATGSLYGSGNSAMIVTTNIPGHNQTGNGNMFSFNLVGYGYAGLGMIDMTIGVYAGENNYYSASWTGTCQTNWI